MKAFLLALAMFSASVSYGECSQVASKAAENIYPIFLGPVTDSQVEKNPLSTSSGVSLIVTLNPLNPQSARKYLVLMNNSCTDIGYVMSYAYVRLLEAQ